MLVTLQVRKMILCLTIEEERHHRTRASDPPHPIPLTCSRSKYHFINHLSCLPNIAKYMHRHRTTNTTPSFPSRKRSDRRPMRHDTHCPLNRSWTVHIRRLDPSGPENMSVLIRLETKSTGFTSRLASYPASLGAGT